MGMLVETIDRIRAIMLGRMTGSPGLTEMDTTSGSPLWREVNAVAYEVRKLVVSIVTLSLNCVPSTAAGIWLDRWAATFLSSGRRVATAWAGTNTLQAEVGATPIVPIGTEIVHADGTRYETTEAVAAADWSGGYVTIDAVAITLGTDANKANGTTLAVVSPPVGLRTSCTIASTTTLGQAAESDTLLRARLLNETSGRPGSGKPADLRAWAMEAGVSGIVDACVYPRCDAGVPQVVVVLPLTDTPGARFTTTLAQRNAILAYLDTQVPIGTDPAVAGSGYAMNLHSVTVTMSVRPKSGYQGDWPVAFAPTIPSFDAPAMRINLSADPTGIITPGDRAVVPWTIGAVTERRQVRVVTCGPGGATPGTMTVDEWPGTPVVPLAVTSGGPLWQPIRDAIGEHFDSLGGWPAVAGWRPRWPDHNDELTGSIYLSDLSGVVEQVEGVQSVTISAPAADQVGTSDFAASPGVTDGYVLDPNFGCTFVDL